MSNDDLHICSGSNGSTGSKASVCQCPPEYYCVDICGEGYLESISTLISWQHFPRSTSTRSRCDDSSEEIQFKRSVTTSSTPEVTEKLEEEPTTPSSTEYPITKSTGQLNAQHYLQIRHVYELFNFLIGHLVCNEPDDPITFLEDLLEKCIKYRDSFGEPPLLFTHHHIKSLYKAFDPFERGKITLEQYEDGMKCLGLASGPTPYNEKPPTVDQGFVTEREFILEAERCLMENLEKMFKIPKPWEENRLKWKAKMLKMFPHKSEKNAQGKESVGGSTRTRQKKFCTCAGPDQQKVICDCAPKPRQPFEPKQLFLEDFVI